MLINLTPHERGYFMTETKTKTKIEASKKVREVLDLLEEVRELTQDNDWALLQGKIVRMAREKIWGE